MSVITEQTPIVLESYGDADAFSVVPQVITTGVVAYAEETSNNPRTLTLGATSNVAIETVNDVNIYLKDGTSGGNVSLFKSSYDSQTQVRTDVKFLNFSDDSNALKTQIASASARALKLSPGDAQKTVEAGSMTMKSASGYNVLSTTDADGFKFISPVTMASDFNVGGNIAANSAIVSYNGVFAPTMNLFKETTNDSNLNTAGSANTVDQVGFAMNINGKNQLEMIKMFRVTDSNNNHTYNTTRVAVFDKAIDVNNPGSNANYLAFDTLDGVNVVDPDGTVVSNGTGNGTASLNDRTFRSVVIGNDDSNLVLDADTRLRVTTCNVLFDNNLTVNGNVGFGVVANDGARLDVDGDIRATGSVIASYASDARLKKNVQRIDSALDRLDLMEGVTFDWQDYVRDLGFFPKTMSNEIGLIAQDVQKAVPQAVTLAAFDTRFDAELKEYVSNSGENYLTIDYLRLIPLIIQAVKELRQSMMINK